MNSWQELQGITRVREYERESLRWKRGDDVMTVLEWTFFAKDEEVMVGLGGLQVETHGRASLQYAVNNWVTR